MVIPYLPCEIITDILSRLSFEYAIPCKEVCKTWRDLLAHIKRDKKINLLFAGTHDYMQLNYGGYDEKNNKRLDEQFSFDALTHLTYPYILYSGKRRTYRPMVGSHRGLVCFLQSHDNVDDPINICNPFTKEAILLPYFPLPDDATGDYLVSGFGYLCTTNEYKVVRIHYNRTRFFGGQVQVYTLGDENGWRNKERTFRFLSTTNGILCDGALHWIDDMGFEIVAFDLAYEKFRSVGLPHYFPLKNSDDYAQLLLLGGNLSVVVRRQSLGCTDIWSLKDTKDNHWEKEFTIRSQKDLYHPFALTEERKVLMFKEKEYEVGMWAGMETTFCYYDPNTKTFEEEVNNDVYFERLEGLQAIPSMNNYQNFQAIPYMKTDVSLTALAPDLQVLDWDSDLQVLDWD